MLSTWRSAVAPGTIALCIAAGGELNRVVGHLAMFVTLLAAAFGAALVIALVVNAARRRPVVPALVGIVACMAADVVGARVTFGVPLFVKADAAPAIAAVESWKQVHGSYPEAENGSWAPGFPPELGNALSGTKCMYFTRNGAPILGCRGVVFTKCDYDFATKTWRSWD